MFNLIRTKWIIGLIPLSIVALNHSYAGSPRLTTFHDFFTVNFENGIAPTIKYLSHEGDVANDPDYPLTCDAATTSCRFALTDNATVWSKGTVTYQLGDNANNQPYCIVTILDGSFIRTPSINEATCFNGAYETALSGEDHHYSFSIQLHDGLYKKGQVRKNKLIAN